MEKQLIRELGLSVKRGETTWQKASEEYNIKTGQNINKEAFRKQFSRMNVEPQTNYDTTYGDGTVEAQVIVNLSPEEKHNPEMILRKLGYNPENWEVVFVKCSTWQQHTKEQITKDLYAVNYKIKPRNKEISIEEYAEIAKKVFSENIKPMKITPREKLKGLDTNKLVFLSAIEAHLGKLSNPIDTNTTYDHKIVQERVKKVFNDTINIQEVEQAESCLVIVGGDFFNSESDGETTKGTPQQNDSRYKKLFNVGLDLYKEGIVSLKEHFNNINIKLCAGNHAKDMEFFLYIALQQAFSEDKQVNFSNDYKDTQVHVHGKCALFLNHGEITQKQMLNSLSSEFYKEWGQTQFRYLLQQHLHKREVIQTESGLMAIRTPSICENDVWHYTNRYGIGVIPQQQIIVFDKEKGITSDYFITFEESKKKRLKR